jgi:uncharacterized protein
MRFYQGCTALVTGASTGLGAEFARQLAPHAATLVLVARRNDALESLAATLRHLHPHLDVRVFCADLRQHDRRTALASWLASEKLPVNLLVNNAGLGDHGPFASGDWDRIRDIIELNITALTHLTHLFLDSMLLQGRAAILNVSSVAGFVPIPHMAVYAATKAYVTSLSEALRIELRPRGISLTALCPGPVPTEFFDTATRPDGAHQADHFKTFPAFTLSPAEVVSSGLRALADDRPRVVPGPLLAVAVAAALAVPFFIVRHFLTAKAHSL